MNVFAHNDPILMVAAVVAALVISRGAIAVLRVFADVLAKILQVAVLMAVARLVIVLVSILIVALLVMAHH